MSFAHDWLLILAVAPAAWCAWGWRRSCRRLGLLLKTAALLAIVLALAEPRQEIAETYAAVVVLRDVSASIPEAQRARQESFTDRARDAAGGHSLRPMDFGARAARSLADEAAARSTNIESALRDSMSALPADRVPRIVLMSDGLANEGAVERAVFEARRQGVPIDTVALAGREPPELSLEAAAMPARAFTGERFPIALTVRSPAAADASVELRAEGKTIGESVLRLPEGESVVTVRARLDAAGSSLIEGTLRSPALGEARFAGAVSLRRPRALLITGDGSAAAAPLAGVLTSSGFDLQQADSAAALDEKARKQYDVIVAANENFEAWSEKTKAAAEHFVREGGGFLLIAGERNLYRQPEEQAEEDILQAMLPAKLAPPRLPEGIAVVLVVDKSSSMEGKKMQLARQSALGVVENLRTIDKVGVLAFDNSFEWAVPLQRNEFPAATQKLIGGIVADGGTQIAPALHEAHRAIKPQQTVYKHILLLTDGISEEGDSIALAREAAMSAITISTIGLGQDVNRSYLERVAASAEGKSYFLLDISALEQIVLRDVMEHTGSSVTEKEFTPIADRGYEILADVDIAEPGPLLGWVKFEAKPEADTILRVDDEDPLLIRWQYGLGRSVVFASDAKDRWAANWIAWDGFDRFWANVIRDILPRSAVEDAVTEYDEANDEIVAYYRSSGASATASPPEIYALGPDGYRQARTPERVGAGYAVRFPAEGRFGLFRMRPAADNALFPETAHYRENSELSEYGADAALLETVAAATGGRFNPAAEEIFDTQGKAVERRMDLWPLLLALAIALNLIELLARKGWLPVLGRWA